jgi:hypothetical protein
MRNLSLVCLLTAFITTSASAGFLIDPYIGAGQSKSTADVSSIDGAESFSATGARIGYSFLLLSAGIDYQMGSIDKDKVTSTSVFVGVDMPILIRAWAEVFTSSTYEQDTEVYGIDFKDGTSIGIGFTGLPFVSLNVEVQNINYTMKNVPSIGDVDVKTAQTVFSISLPLDL